MIENIMHQGVLMALIIRENYHSDGIEFFTPNNFSMQLGYMNRPLGYKIDPHIHNLVNREVHFTKEVLIIKSGKIKIDFYSDEKEYLKSRTLSKGDIVLLAFGGHGIEMLEKSEIIEVKQGPYDGNLDKTRFSPIYSNHIASKENN